MQYKQKINLNLQLLLLWEEKILSLLKSYINKLLTQISQNLNYDEYLFHQYEIITIYSVKLIKPEYCQKKNVRSTMPEEKKKEIEHFGNEGAPHFMIVEYCNGCGYYRYAVSVAEKIESLYPQQFLFLNLYIQRIVYNQTYSLDHSHQLIYRIQHTKYQIRQIFNRCFQQNNKFYIELRPDSEQTGRLDVTMFINQQNKQIVDMSSGYKFHATDKGDDIPYKNWEAFTNKVDNALLGQ